VTIVFLLNLNLKNLSAAG